MLFRLTVNQLDCLVESLVIKRVYFMGVVFDPNEHGAAGGVGKSRQLLKPPNLEIGSALAGLFPFFENFFEFNVAGF